MSETDDPVQAPGLRAAEVTRGPRPLEEILERLPTAPGVYNISLTVRGLDRRGLPFERSLTTSFGVGALPAQP